MMGSIAEAFVEIRPETSRFLSEANKGIDDALNKAGGKKTKIDADTSPAERSIKGGIGKVLSATAEEFSDKLNQAGKSLTVKATLPIVAGMAAATKAASDLGEQQSKTSVVFGESAESVKKFASSSAQNLGLSQRAALEAAGTYGNLFRAIGITSSKSAEMSQKLVGLAADLASFNNADPTEVLEALKAGLTGEAEPLKKFGININEARLKQEAMNLGLSQGKGPLDANAKAQAAYSLILKDTTLAQGDFARTSGGLANQTRITKAALEDTAANIGAKLIPIALKLAQAIQTVLGWLDALPDGAQNLLLIASAGAAAAGPVLTLSGHIIGLTNRLLAGGAAARLMGVGLAGLGVAGGIAALIGGIALAVGAFNKVTKASPQQIADLETRLLGIGSTSVKYAGSLGNIARSTKAFADAQDEFTAKFGAHADRAKRTGQEFDGIDKALAGLVRSGNAAQAKRALDEIAEAGGTSAAQLGKNKFVLDDYKLALSETTAETKKKAAADAEAQASAEAGKDETQKQADSYNALKESIDTTKSAMDRYLGVTLDLDTAQDQYQAAIDTLNQKLIDNGITFDVNTEKGRDNRGGLRELVTSIGDMQRAEELASGVTLTDTQRKQRQIDLLREWAQDKGPAVRAEVERYISQIEKTPEKKTTTMELKTDKAEADLEAFRRKLAAALPAGFLGNLGAPAPPAGKPKRAFGGPVTKGESYIVGDRYGMRYAEEFTPRSSGYIHPDVGGSSSANGQETVINQTNHITISTSGDERGLRAALPELIQALRAGVGAQ